MQWLFCIQSKGRTKLRCGGNPRRTANAMICVENYVKFALSCPIRATLKCLYFAWLCVILERLHCKYKLLKMSKKTYSNGDVWIEYVLLKMSMLNEYAYILKLSCITYSKWVVSLNTQNEYEHILKYPLTYSFQTSPVEYAYILNISI